MTYDYSIVNMGNIKILRDYLDGLPADYSDFDMSLYASDYDKASNATPKTGCGTSACALGHGPSSGIKKLSKEGWRNYRTRAFFYDAGELALFAFSCMWNNSIPEAVARLDLILSQSVPTEWTHEDRFAESLQTPSVIDMLMMDSPPTPLLEGPKRTRTSPTIRKVES